MLDVKVPNWIGDSLKPLVDVNGLVVRPLQAIILNEGQFVKPEKDKNLTQTAAHEILHVLAENSLPMLLDEAATDIYAERALDMSVNSQMRMGANFRLACELWHVIEKSVGSDIAFSAYMEPSLIKEVRRKPSDKIVERQFIDHPLHNILREQLGRYKSDKYTWDVILNLVEQKRVNEALKLFNPGHIF